MANKAATLLYGRFLTLNSCEKSKVTSAKFFSSNGHVAILKSDKKGTQKS